MSIDKDHAPIYCYGLLGTFSLVSFQINGLIVLKTFGKTPQYRSSICSLNNDIIILIPTSTQTLAKVCY